MPWVGRSGATVGAAGKMEEQCHKTGYEFGQLLVDIAVLFDVGPSALRSPARKARELVGDGEGAEGGVLARIGPQFDAQQVDAGCNGYTVGVATIPDMTLLRTRLVWRQ